MQLTWQQSIGIEDTHLTSFEDKQHSHLLVNVSTVEPLSKLLKQAEQDGVAITIISGFRSFKRQLTIWNDKWQGYKPVYSRQGRPLNILKMSDIEKYKAISLWSALPGLSRHHWGTDFDIFSSQALAKNYEVQLQPEEFAKNGPCFELNTWLENNLESFGFFRPYRNYQQGVSKEPWHISHQSVSQAIYTQFDKPACRDYLATSEINSANFIKEQFEHYYARYFSNICKPQEFKEVI
jgi:LAS superfamily LD-carboxypeptidase LdcB